MGDLAHLTGWSSHTISRLEAAARGEPEPPPPWPEGLDSDDTINAWFHEQGNERPTEEVLAEASVSYDRIAAAIAALPETAQADPNRFPWTKDHPLGQLIVDGVFFAHLHEEHEPSVRAWLAATA
jgi:hypothetical protein